MLFDFIVIILFISLFLLGKKQTNFVTHAYWLFDDIKGLIFLFEMKKVERFFIGRVSQAIWMVFKIKMYFIPISFSLLFLKKSQVLSLSKYSFHQSLTETLFRFTVLSSLELSTNLLLFGICGQSLQLYRYS